MSSKLGKGKHDYYTKLFSFIQIFEWKSSSQSTEHSSKRIYRGLLICRETAVLWIGFLYFLFFLPKKTDSWQHCSVRKLPLFSSWMKILEFFLIYIISSRQIENVMKIFLKSHFIRVSNWHFQVFITRLSGNHFWAVPNTLMKWPFVKRGIKLFSPLGQPQFFLWRHLERALYRVSGNWPNSYTWIGYHRLIGPPRALLSINVDHNETVPT